MKKKNSLILDDEFINYCQLNNIDDIDKLAKETFNRGFTLLKYGDKPKIIQKKEPKIVETPKPIQTVEPTPIVTFTPSIEVTKNIIKERDLYAE